MIISFREPLFAFPRMLLLIAVEVYSDDINDTEEKENFGMEIFRNHARRSLQRHSRPQKSPGEMSSGNTEQ